MATSPTSSTFAAAMGAAMLAGHLQYPVSVESYEIQQVRGSHSDFMENLVRFAGTDQFVQQVAVIYKTFAQGQARLGIEFEAAIFSDLESLYEA